MACVISGRTVIGLSAGLSLTPVLLGHALTFTPYILGGVFISIGMGLALSGFLARAAHLDATTAFFASVPGGVAEMSNLAERYGGDVAAVAIAQTLRIFMAVLTVPLLARFFGRAAGHSAPLAAGTLANARPPRRPYGPCRAPVLDSHAAAHSECLASRCDGHRRRRRVDNSNAI